MPRGSMIDSAPRRESSRRRALRHRPCQDDPRRINMEDRADAGVHRWSLREAWAVHHLRSLGSRPRGGQRLRLGGRCELDALAGGSSADSRRDRTTENNRTCRRRFRSASFIVLRPTQSPRIQNQNHPSDPRLNAPEHSPRLSPCGWHITLDGRDVYSWKVKALVNIAGPACEPGTVRRPGRPDRACRRVFASDTRWTILRGERPRGG